MNHGPHRIQQEGWIFQIGEKAAGITGQRGKGKGKTPEQKERDRLRKIELRKLQKTGQHVRQVNPPPAWFKCSCCMANIGLGSQAAGTLIGVASTSVSRQWRDRGIVSQKPTTLGYYPYMLKARSAQKEAEEMPSKAYKEAAMGEIRQHQSKAVYPCWSVIWTAEQNRRNAAKAYQGMPEEIKRAKYLRQHHKRMTDPEARKKKAEYMRKWNEANPDKRRKTMRDWQQKRRKEDPGYRAQCNLRNRFKEIMGVVLDPTRKWNSSLIGCDTRQLAAHLQAQFKRGMSWENYGTHWHVDHIVPCSKFDHTIPAHVRQCWHYTNLQPLEAAVNLAKSDKILNDTQLCLML